MGLLDVDEKKERFNVKTHTPVHIQPVDYTLCPVITDCIVVMSYCENNNNNNNNNIIHAREQPPPTKFQADFLYKGEKS